MSIGERIKKLRKNKNLTLRKLAKKANISPSFLSDIENNRSNPSLNKLKDITKALNTNISYLLEESNKSNKKTINKIEQAISDNPELLEFWEKLSSREDLQLIFKQVKDLDPKSVQKIIEIIKIIENKNN